MLVLTLLLLQDPVAIELRPAQGDRLSVVDKWTYDFQGKLGEEPITSSSRGARHMRVEMAKVEGGRLDRKVVQFEDAYVEELDVHTGKFIRREDPVRGRKVTISRRDGKDALEGVDGLPEPSRKSLTLIDPLTRLLPEKPVKPGDTWELAGEGLRRIFTTGDFTEGKIGVKLVTVKEIDGRRCAILATKYDVKGKAPGVEMELQIAGELTIWIERGYVMAMTQKGVLKTKPIGDAKGIAEGKASITGELTATILEK